LVQSPLFYSQQTETIAPQLKGGFHLVGKIKFQEDSLELAYDREMNGKETFLIKEGLEILLHLGILATHTSDTVGNNASFFYVLMDQRGT